MEVNGFRELVNVTTKGKWLDTIEFEALVAVVLAGAGINASWLKGKKLIRVIVEMIEIGFVEFDADTSQIRIKEHWYEQQSKSL